MISLIWLVDAVFRVLQLIILADVLLSWFRPDPYNPIVRTIREVAGVILDPIRRVVPPLGGLDITPIIALILLQLLEGILIGLLR
jgi:YggT family protein